jgi:hypothetical protein
MKLKLTYSNTYCTHLLQHKIIFKMFSAKEKRKFYWYLPKFFKSKVLPTKGNNSRNTKHIRSENHVVGK